MEEQSPYIENKDVQDNTTMNVLIAFIVFVVLYLLYLLFSAKQISSTQQAAPQQVAPINKYKGCFADCANGARDLPNLINGGAGMTKSECEAAARSAGSKYYGVQWREGHGNADRGQCWTGNSFGSQGARSNCSKSGDQGYPGHAIGGSCSNAVYEL